MSALFWMESRDCLLLSSANESWERYPDENEGKLSMQFISLKDPFGIPSLTSLLLPIKYSWRSFNSSRSTISAHDINSCNCICANIISLPLCFLFRNYIYIALIESQIFMVLPILTPHSSNFFVDGTEAGLFIFLTESEQFWRWRCCNPCTEPGILKWQSVLFVTHGSFEISSLRVITSPFALQDVGLLVLGISCSFAFMSAI